jgi:hypothetical protein
MTQSRVEFAIKTLIFCAILFTLTTAAHAIAIDVAVVTHRQPTSSTYYNPYTGQWGSKAPANNTTTSTFDISEPTGLAVALLTGIELPMPYPLLISVWNFILIGLMSFCTAELIRSWFWPFPS